MTFDFIIIGAGSAGCVLANRLSENPKHSVLLLEAGGRDKSLKIDIPLAYSQLYHTKYDWDLSPKPLQRAKKRIIFYPRGKGLGGSSLINSMIYIRGNRKDYDNWSELGNKGWSYDEILPYFKKSENHWKGESKFHGKDGLLGITPAFERYSNPLWEALKNSGKDIGLKPNNDFNGKKQEGLGIFDMSIKNAKRQSTASTFLKAAKQRSNLTILTNAQTSKIDIKNKKASGVIFIHEGKTKTAMADKEVILSAGAIHSPQILMLSGIGNREVLGKVGIKVEHELKGVGQNLKDHYFFPICYEINQRISYNSQMQGLNKLKNTFRYFLTKKGPMTIGAASSGGFVNIDSDRPDLQFHFVPTWSYRIDAKPEELPKSDGIMMLPTILHPKSTGSISLKSNKITDEPDIELNFFDKEYDRTFAIKAYRFAHQLLNAASFDDYRTKIVRPERELTDAAEILDWILTNVDTCYHPVGTCKMGNDENAVVNDKLQVRGIKNLRVIDASIMPTIVSGNTNAPTIMIAEKGADLLLV
ncbi:MAG: GMC family oxidoreductase [Saprospiraceae bacterium]